MINGNRFEIDMGNIQRSYEYFESALELLKSLKIRDFVSRFYYGIGWFLNGIFRDLKGKWHGRERYKNIFSIEKHAAVENVWKYFKALRIVADYGYHQGKNWNEYEEKFWEEAQEYIEHFLDYLKDLEKEIVEIVFIKEKVEEIRIWLALISNVKK